MGYIDKSGGYYVGDRQGDDATVPDRPSTLHMWNGAVWTLDTTAQASQRRAEILARMTAIDAESIRPAREISAALTAAQALPPFTSAKLATLEAEAATLRAELRDLQA